MKRSQKLCSSNLFVLFLPFSFQLVEFKVSDFEILFTWVPIRFSTINCWWSGVFAEGYLPKRSPKIPPTTTKSLGWKYIEVLFSKRCSRENHFRPPSTLEGQRSKMVPENSITGIWQNILDPPKRGLKCSAGGPCQVLEGIKMLLLTEQIPNNHLGCIKPCK